MKIHPNKLRLLINPVTLFFSLILVPLQSQAIVNMDALHFNKVEDKFSIELELTISGSNGNSQSSDAALNGQFSRVGNNSINLIILGYQYGESNDVRSENKSFIDYRYIHCDLLSTSNRGFFRLQGLFGTNLDFKINEKLS